MVWAKIVMIVVGMILILGSAGQSDYEAMALGREITPFWQIVLVSATGLVFVVLGMITPISKVRARR